MEKWRYLPFKGMWKHTILCAITFYQWEDFHGNKNKENIVWMSGVDLFSNARLPIRHSKQDTLINYFTRESMTKNQCNSPLFGQFFSLKKRAAIPVSDLLFQKCLGVRVLSYLIVPPLLWEIRQFAAVPKNISRPARWSVLPCAGSQKSAVFTSVIHSK